MSARITVAAVAATALAFVPAAWSGTVSGSGLAGGDRVEVGANSSAEGVQGHAEAQFNVGTDAFANVGGQVVCIRVEANQAIVAWKLRSPFDAFGTTWAYGGVYIQDNGDPVNGQPVDRMADFVTNNIERFCAYAFDFLAFVAQPLTSGNYVVSDS
ncbi:MAG TPA: hypothetical protein VGQ38_03530 [Gaiellaceae bacterium]|jgi:hypothetical protein|nr:hypothetical protein [Gaiellaceae bacterium]